MKRDRDRRVTIVWGPPGSGKTTYVQEYRKPGDLVWDFDAVLRTVTGVPSHYRESQPHPLVMALRDSFFRYLIGHRDTADVWIIESVPTRLERERRRQQLGAVFVGLLPSAEECKRRTRERGAGWPEAIDYWFGRYEPDAEQSCRS
jgi:hypothetical protein